MNENNLDPEVEYLYNIGYNILTEDGLDVTDFKQYLTEAVGVPNDNIIREGKIVEIAREAKRLLENGDKEGFWNLLMVTEVDSLDAKQSFLLMGTKLFDEPWTIYQELNRIETNRLLDSMEDDDTDDFMNSKID